MRVKLKSTLRCDRVVGISLLLNHKLKLIRLSLFGRTRRAGVYSNEQLRALNSKINEGGVNIAYQ
jgi:hypothetical protein